VAGDSGFDEVDLVALFGEPPGAAHADDSGSDDGDAHGFRMALFSVNRGLRTAKVLEYWSIGVLEYWSVGVLECWSVGVLRPLGVGASEPQRVQWWAETKKRPRPSGLNSAIAIYPGRRPGL